MKKVTFLPLGFFQKITEILDIKKTFVVVLLLFSTVFVYGQTHPYGFLDGDVVNNDGNLDWEDVFNDTGLPAGSISTGIVFDAILPDDIFTGGSTKDHLPISGWLNKFQDGSSSDKSNILQGGAILIDGRIYFFGNRFSNEGATNIGFWFFQDDVNILDGSFEGNHEIGDILVVAEISNGGAVGKISAYEWRGNAANGGNVPSSTNSLIQIVDENNPQPNLLSAVVNSVPASTPWPYQAKGEMSANVMPEISFFEGFINIAGLNLNNACFSSFLVETRSSFSLTSILEDFIGSNFNVEPVVTIDDITDCEDEFPKDLVASVDGGIPPLIFEWKKDGVIIPMETSSSISVNESGTYSVIVTGSGVGGIGTCSSEADTAIVTLKDNPEPSVDDESACVGDTATFSTADLGAGFTYQWYLNDVEIMGATSNEYTTAALTLAEDGDVYKVIVTDTNESTNCTGEDSGTLSVNANPAPSVDDESACVGDTATFSTADLGAGFTYQWYLNDVEIMGATSNEYTTAALTLSEDGDVYKVIVTDTNESTNCTGEDSGTLSVNANPVPSVDDESACVGDTATFSTTDLGAGFSYQWYLNDVEIMGATSNEYTTAALTLSEDGDVYKVIVTDTNESTNCTGEDSGTLSVNANPAPSVDDESACVGDTATFSTADLGAGFTYQWYLNDVEIMGATSNEYTTAALTLAEDDDVYKVIVTDTNESTNCTGEDSGTLSVNANPAPSVDDESACVGDTATFSTADLGAGFTYQWYLNDVEIMGATSNEYTTAALTLAEDGDVYKVIVTDTNESTNCTGEDSGTLSVNANPAPSVDDESACVGDTATFSTADLGAGFTYQWYLNDVEIMGATSNEYTTAALTLSEDGDVYKVIVTDTNESTNCTGEDSGTLSVNANPAPSVDDESACVGDTATFSTADLGAGFTYQWYLNDVEIMGATSNEYTTAALTLSEDGDVYKVIVTDTNESTNCTGEDSGTLSVNANPAPSVDDESACVGDTATFSTADLGAGFSYQWYLNDVEIMGATSNEYTTAALTLAEDDDVYKVIVTNDAETCTGEDSGTLSVNANPAPSVDDESACVGDTATFSTADLGAGFTYQWYLNDVEIMGATSNEYTTAALTLAEDDDVYKVIVTDTNESTNCTGEDSGTLSVNANPAPSVDDESACVGDTATFSTADLGAGFTYQWYLNDVEIMGATSNEYTTAALTLSEDGDVYKVIVTDTNESTNCTGEDSGTLSVNANPAPSVDDESACVGDTATFSTADLGAGFSYQWYLNDVEIMGATSNEYTTAALTLSEDGDVYKVIVTNDSETCSGEDSGVVTVNPNPTFDTLEPQLTCFGEAPSIAVTSDTSGLEFRLVVKGEMGSFADYAGPYADLEYNTDYVLTARSKTGPTFCETDYEFTTPIPIDIPSNLFLTVNDPTCDTYDGSTYFGSIQIDNHVPGYLYAVVDQATFVDIESVPASDYMDYDATSGLISGIAVGSYYVIAKSPDGCLSAIAPALLIEPNCITCETAFARDASSANCFDQYPDLIPNDNRWGWTNYYESAGNYSLDLYAGAGQCDISKGALAGEVNIFDNGDGTIDVQFVADPGYIMSSVHLYVGCEPLPYKKKGKNYDYTVAPGQYPQNPQGSIGYVTEYTIENISVSGDFYLIAHTDICTSENADLITSLRAESVPVVYTPKKRFSAMQTCIDNGASETASKSGSESLSISDSTEPLFSIAPVPFRDVLNVGYLFDYTSDVTIQVFDLNGRLLTTYKDTAVNSNSVSSFNVDFRAKSNQIYIVRMTTDREVYTTKVIASK